VIRVIEEQRGAKTSIYLHQRDLEDISLRLRNRHPFDHSWDLSHNAGCYNVLESQLLLFRGRGGIVDRI